MREFNVEVDVSSRIVQKVRMVIMADNASQIKDVMKDWPNVNGSPEGGEPHASRCVIVESQHTPNTAEVKHIRMLDE